MTDPTPIDLMTYDGELEYVEQADGKPTLVCPARIVARDCIPVPILVLVRRPGDDPEDAWDDPVSCGPEGQVRTYRGKGQLRPKRKRVTTTVHVYLLDDGSVITSLAPIQTVTGLRKRVGAKIIDIEVVEGEGL